MNWLNAIGTGLGFLGGIGGLFSGLNAQRQQEQAEQNAIRDLSTAQNEDVLATQGAGLEEIAGLSGTLTNQLGAQARGLGAAEAGAGVYNSSAVAGAVANEAAANSATVGRATSNLAQTLARIRAQNAEQVANMRYGFAANNLNFARQQTSGSVNGLSSMLSRLAQVNLNNNSPANPNVTGNGNMNVTGDMGPALDPSAGAPGTYAYSFPSASSYSGYAIGGAP